jgi:crotonobetainyl-CoA:carnitine CoA-transferase CaiB-like acyl-CoA transferase
VLVPQIVALMVQRPRAHWVDGMRAVGVPCAPVNTLREAVALAGC